ncbi:MAG TPA: LLM class flavin-dependent oxidoreductase [Polyangiaceae bacterium]|nr:LLM class flavin-dependent oxidoreductase [Polyangiaceae bacterium]
MSVPLSILDLAFVRSDQSVGEAFADVVTFARHAEALGYRRIWYAEHHNFPSIASSATSVLIAHVAAHTRTIRLGAGGIMLPNHSPLVIAEQFGTLASLHPGRIDLGLGRAPGTDPETIRALRVRPHAAEAFPEDVLELQALLGDESPFPGVSAMPGRGTHVPLYILGSSLFGARLAARLGLPYAFASHFAPAALHPAVELYRSEFRASKQLALPYVIAGVNAFAADTRAEAEEHFRQALRARVRALFGRGKTFSDEDVELILDSPAGEHVKVMGTYSAIGTRSEVKSYVDEFARRAHADEVIVVHAARTLEARMRSAELLIG